MLKWFRTKKEMEESLGRKYPIITHGDVCTGKLSEKTEAVWKLEQGKERLHLVKITPISYDSIILTPSELKGLCKLLREVDGFNI